MRRQLIFAVGSVLVAIAGIAYTAISGNEPLLGLDLQGGASVVLEPEPNEDGSIPSAEVLDQAVEIIRNRIDGLGVREPEISRAGSTILVQIPGVEDQQRAIDLVGQTAELRFRPVLADGIAGVPIDITLFPDCASLLATQGFTAPTTSTTTTSTTSTTTTTSTVPAETEQGASTTTTPTEVLEDTTTEPDITPTQDLITSEPTQDANADECMVASAQRSPDVRYLLGPAPLLTNQQTNPGARLTGEVLDTAAARLRLSEWVVNIIFREGSPGIDDFNALAAQCASGSPTCPPLSVSEISGALVGRVAVEIDGAVESAPTVGVANFDREGVVISGGGMTETIAKDLALVLRFGSLPVELVPQESRIVSSTLGEDALDAGILAGIIGLGLVSIYLLIYYRFLGLVAISSLAISGALLWTMIAFLGASQGLALTLAGVTGLIVSIGVSVDSNVVYFEHLKEDVRSGRTVRSAVERAFPIAFSTIVKADVASLIAAVVLYFLTVGQVRGFALFLGLATILDLLATYFFMGPVIRLMARRKAMVTHPTRFGISVGQPTPSQVTS